MNARLFCISATLPPGRSMRPQEPANSVSPQNRQPSVYRQTPPFVWPGVCQSRKDSPAASTVPSAAGQGSSMRSGVSG